MEERRQDTANAASSAAAAPGSLYAELQRESSRWPTEKDLLVLILYVTYPYSPIRH